MNHPRWLIPIPVFFITATIGFAQMPQLEWAGSFVEHNLANYTDNSNGRTVGVDQQGNVYSAGLFMHTVDFDPGPGVVALSSTAPFETSIYITKQGPDGKLIWVKEIPTYVEFGNIELKVDKQGNVYLTSDLKVTADIDPGPGVLMVKPTGFRDAFVIKLNTNGGLVWFRQIGGPGDTGPQGSCLDLDAQGNVIICGVFNNTVDFDPGPGKFEMTAVGNFNGFVVKLTNDGDFIWAGKIGDFKTRFNNAGIEDIRCDPAGNIYFTGIFSGDCDFDPGPGRNNLVSVGSNDGFITKLDANGKFVWARKIGNTEGYQYHMPKGIDLDANNNVYTIGTFQGTQDFDPGPVVHNLSSNAFSYDVYLLKLTTDGDFIWVKPIGGSGYDVGADLDIDDYGNLYTSATYSQSVDLDPGPGTHIIDNLVDETVVTKFDLDGNFIYAAPFFGIGSSYSLGRRMAIDHSQSIYLAGTIAGTMDADPGTEEYLVSSGNNSAPFVLKLSLCKDRTSSTMDISVCNSYTLNAVTYSSSGTYYQTLPNSKGCDSTITLNLAITKKLTEQNKTICAGETWFAGGEDQSRSGTYTDTLSTSLGCDSIVLTHLIVRDPIHPDLGPDKDLCLGTSISLSPGSFNTYSWQNNSHQSSLSIDQPGLYWVEVTDTNNCSARDSMQVGSLLPNPSHFLNPADSICLNDTKPIAPIGQYSSYHWSTGETSRQVELSAPGQYWLAVTDEHGCTAKETVMVYGKDCAFGVYVPTAFSPNGDGRNDVFKAVVIGKLLSFRLQVFDRMGQLVFETTSPSKGWNGSFNGKYFSTANFAWQCIYQLKGAKPTRQKGSCVLIR